MNEHDKVMTENFAERFVDHRNIGLAPQTVSELPFHHAKRGLDIGPLVIMRHKFVPLELKVVKHLFPSPSTPALVVRRESYVRDGSETRTRARLISGQRQLLDPGLD